MRLLDVSADGSDLIAASRVIWSTEGVSNPFTDDCRPAELREHLLQPDAHSRREDDRVCRLEPLTPPRPVTAGGGRWTLAWLAYSTSDPTVARTLAQVTLRRRRVNSPAIDLLWADSSGGTLIGTWSIETASVRPRRFPEPAVGLPAALGRDRRRQVPAS